MIAPPQLVPAVRTVAALQAVFQLRYAQAMEIKEEKKEKKGEFYIEENGKRIAKIQFFDSGEGTITVYHTEVDPSLRGKGIGEDLVERVVGYARDNNLRIVASCPYAKKLIERDPGLSSVLG